MNSKVDLFDSTYSNFEAEVLARIRRKTFGEDFGQNSWTTAEEYRQWSNWLSLDSDSHVLEVASGSGGPAILLAQVSGCRVTGIDINPHGIAAARERAKTFGLGTQVTFQQVDAGAALPFSDDTFDALICVDSANHFPDRQAVLKEWYRVLKSGGQALFTDPVVITGLVSSEELAIRSSVGYFVFTPPQVNEQFIQAAGLKLIRAEDVSENAWTISGRWHDARAEDREALIQIEGEDRFTALQKFFANVQQLTSEQRLSRIVYLAKKV